MASASAYREVPDARNANNIDDGGVGSCALSCMGRCSYEVNVDIRN
jgi:hypothetical protein